MPKVWWVHRIECCFSNFCTQLIDPIFDCNKTYRDVMLNACEGNEMRLVCGCLSLQFIHCYSVASRFMVLIKMKINFNVKNFVNTQFIITIPKEEMLSHTWNWMWIGCFAVEAVLNKTFDGATKKKLRCVLYRSLRLMHYISERSIFTAKNDLLHIFELTWTFCCVFVLNLGKKQTKLNGSTAKTHLYQTELVSAIFLVRHHADCDISVNFGPKTNACTYQIVNIIVRFGSGLIFAMHIQCTRATCSCHFWRLPISNVWHFSSEIIVFEFRNSSRMHGLCVVLVTPLEFRINYTNRPCNFHLIVVMRMFCQVSEPWKWSWHFRNGPNRFSRYSTNRCDDSMRDDDKGRCADIGMGIALKFDWLFIQTSRKETIRLKKERKHTPKKRISIKWKWNRQLKMPIVRATLNVT